MPSLSSIFFTYLVNQFPTPSNLYPTTIYILFLRQYCARKYIELCKENDNNLFFDLGRSPGGYRSSSM